MRTTYITAGLLSFALALVMSLSAAAQTSATTPSPQAAPSQSAPQSDPQAAPSQAPSQSAPSQNEPSQAPPAAPSGSASQSDQGQAQSQAHSEDDNPLNLTDEQKAKLRPIIADENQQIESIRNDSTMTMDQKVAKANQVRDNASPKIKAILTPEQIQKLAELQKKKQQQSAPSDSQKPQN